MCTGVQSTSEESSKDSGSYSEPHHLAVKGRFSDLTEDLK